MWLNNDDNAFCIIYIDTSNRTYVFFISYFGRACVPRRGLQRRRVCNLSFLYSLCFRIGNCCHHMFILGCCVSLPFFVLSTVPAVPPWFGFCIIIETCLLTSLFILFHSACWFGASAGWSLVKTEHIGTSRYWNFSIAVFFKVKWHADL
jgi:hypothetical protein